jgi:uncharacterized repeat protein (TIGR03837 family)
MPKSWDIFCNVVDNFGDIGVCWRLARQLANEQGAVVRLWVDKLESFQALCPQVDCGLAVQTLQGVEIRRWSPAFGHDTTIVPAEVVVEGFGCRLPGSFLAAMAARTPQPVWINLEYLSAEDWVESHHCLPSPHPQLPLVKYFFFPGFTEHTGGLPVERDLALRRGAFQREPAAVNAFRAAIGVAPAQPDTLVTSLFCYEDAAVPELLDAWAKGANTIECLVPAGPPLRRVAALTGPLRPGEVWRSGRLQVNAIPFLDQDAYDRLLWASDLNFVRGEDSFVRAQLAARPLVWQVYAQDADAHLLKMDAFLGRYCRGMDDTLATALRQFWQAWNQPPEGRPDWPALWQAVLAAKPAWQGGAQAWAARLQAAPSLADNLAFFCQSKLK